MRYQKASWGWAVEWKIGLSLVGSEWLGGWERFTKVWGRPVLVNPVTDGGIQHAMVDDAGTWRKADGHGPSPRHWLVVNEMAYLPGHLSYDWWASTPFITLGLISLSVPITRLVCLGHASPTKSWVRVFVFRQQVLLVWTHKSCSTGVNEVKIETENQFIYKLTSRPQGSSGKGIKILFFILLFVIKRITDIKRVPLKLFTTKILE